jgi:hypothetical protein
MVEQRIWCNVLVSVYHTTQVNGADYAMRCDASTLYCTNTHPLVRQP